MAFDQKAANVWVARIIPLVLIGIVCYVSFVLVSRVGVLYLLQPSTPFRQERNGAAIAILTIYFVLLLLMSCAFFRILYVIATNPGYVPRGLGKIAENKSGTSSSEKTLGSGEAGNGETRATAANTNHYAENLARGRANAEKGLQKFYEKDVFVCQGDGRPIWCTKCMNHKPDRAHHCREVERCVRRMDHFCPWVGGIVSETNFKFFLQFVAWTATYCIFVLAVLGVFIGEVKKQGEQIDVHWIVTIVFAAFFASFTIGMTASSLQIVLLNTTTVENLSRKTKVWTLAIYIPRSIDTTKPLPFQTITYPLQSSTEDPTSPSSPSAPHRTFAILHTQKGENPYNLGPYENFQTVMGTNFLDWILPIRYSPLCDHESGESAFRLGPVVERMRREAGIDLSRGSDGEKPRRRRKSRHASIDDGRLPRSKRSSRRHGEKAGRRAQDVADRTANRRGVDTPEQGQDHVVR